MRIEKILILFMSIIFVCMLFGCTSTRIQSYGNPATEVRTELDGLRAEQAESARTGERIRAESNELADLNRKINDTIREGTEYYDTIRAIIDQIRSGQYEPSKREE